MLISEKAKNLLHYLVDIYKSTGRSDFDIMDYSNIIDYEKKLIELHNHGLIIYDVSKIADSTILTDEGINYKF